MPVPGLRKRGQSIVNSHGVIQGNRPDKTIFVDLGWCNEKLRRVIGRDLPKLM